MVRSYVTNPTTIKAITEIPAKTPRPMGRTDNFFPGNSNAPVDAAEELPPVPVAPGGDEVPDDEVLVVVGDAADGPDDEVLVVVAVDNGDAVSARVGVTVDRPLTTISGVVEDVKIEEVGDGVGVRVGVEVGVVVVAPVTGLLVGMPEVAVNVPGMVDVKVLETAEGVGHADEPGVQVMEIVHALTSCTAGFPLLSVMGVRVTTQVSTNGPAGV